MIMYPFITVQLFDNFPIKYYKLNDISDEIKRNIFQIVDKVTIDMVIYCTCIHTAKVCGLYWALIE